MYREVHADNIEGRAISPAVVDLLAIYRGTAANGDMPPLAALDPNRLEAFAGNLMVLMPEAGGHYRYDYFGVAIAAATGADMTGRRSSDMTSETSRLFQDSYDLALSQSRPILTLHKGNDPGALHLWEQLILPVRRPDGKVAFVVHSAPLAARPELLSSILHATDDGILSLAAVRDDDGRMVDALIETANVRASILTNRPLSDLIGRRLLEAFPTLVDEQAWARHVAVVAERRTERFEINYTDNGVSAWFRVTLSPLRDGFVLTFTDITDLKNAVAELEARRASLAEEIVRRSELERRLNGLVRTDTLTSLLNRHGFEDEMRRIVATARRYGTALSAIIVDADNFKAINDTYGHAIGDAALVHLAQLLRKGLRAEVDIVGRIGGEEFAVLLQHTDTAGAARVAERLRATLTAAPLVFATGSLTMTASFGVATLDARDDSAASLIKRADEALYRAKRDGRNRVICAEPIELAAA